MKNLSIYILAALCVLMPGVAAAHAVPLESLPASEVLSEAPGHIEIRFSERIDVRASRIHVTGPSGEMIETADPTHVGDDAYRIAVPVRDDGDGAYLVQWSVVSRDDGHFTKGAYPYAVGAGAELDSSVSTNTEIVQIATRSEVTSMTVELFGHGLLWALVVLYAFVVRRLRRAGELEESNSMLSRYFAGIATVGALLAIGGGALQIWFKARDLALLHESGFLSALSAYATTEAGEATLVRISAAAMFMLFAVASSRRIIAASRFSWYEGLLFGLLAIFAFERARISHATANHFFPDLSLAVNFVHLIEKDIWAGILTILVAALLYRPTRHLFSHMLPRSFTLLSVNLALVSVTASYIVWLHLRSFENLLTTKWGIAFVQLLIAATLILGVRIYHVVVRAWVPRMFARFLPLSLVLELVLALAVIFASSAVIITSPPQQDPQTPLYAVHSEGARISLERYPYWDGFMRIQIRGGTPSSEPSAVLTKEGVAPIELDLMEHYPGSYLFPAVLIPAEAESIIEVRQPQHAAYDAVAEFRVPASAFDLTQYGSGTRALDSFTLVFMATAAGGLVLALVMWRLSRRQEAEGRVTPFVDSVIVAAAFLAAAGTALLLALTFSYAAYVNTYKRACERDGNMWHVMLPTWAGEPRSLTPREGCMWGMGSFTYMFPEGAEYAYYRSLPESNASIDFIDDPVAGQEVDFRVAVRYPDGTPAKLLVDMEKLIHVVVVSEDQTVFAHIHPDDTRELSAAEKEDSTFGLSYVFPKAGRYLIAIDYANGVVLESSQHIVEVAGAPAQESDRALYTSPAAVGDFVVSLDYAQPLAGEVTTLVYEVSKNGQPAPLEPYLAAAMHIAVVKNDLAAFAHTHGEVHPPGAISPPVVVRDGKIVHSMAAMTVPPTFSYPIDAHVIFPERGLYTVWGQFKSGGEVYAVPFTVRVE